MEILNKTYDLIPKEFRVKIVLIFCRNIKWYHCFFQTCVPIKIFEPRMLFDFLQVVKSTCWIFLYAFVDKVCCFLRIIFPDLSWFNLDLFLFSQNSISYFILYFSFVGSLTCHAFIADNTKGKVVSFCIMLTV